MPNDVTIDLGYKHSEMVKPMTSDPKDEVMYPTIEIKESGDYEFPEGDFEFTGVARKVASEEMELPDGSTRHCCTLEIHSIKPGSSKAQKSSPKSKDVGEGLDEALETISKKKADDQEEMDE